MLVHICDNKKCKKVLIDESSITTIELPVQGKEPRKIELCSNCASRLLQGLDIYVNSFLEYGMLDSVNLTEDNTQKFESEEKSVTTKTVKNVVKRGAPNKTLAIVEQYGGLAKADAFVKEHTITALARELKCDRTALGRLLKQYREECDKDSD